MNKWHIVYLFAIGCFMLGMVEGNHITTFGVAIGVVDIGLFETGARLGLVSLGIFLWLTGLYYGAEPEKEIKYTDLSEVELND